MPKSQPTEQEAEYTLADIQASASNFDTTTWAVAGVFRAAGKDRMTEAEFRAGLEKWRGERD